MFEHPNAKTVWFTIDFEPDGTMHNAMVVETDLVLHVLEPGHDKGKVDSLLAAVADFVKNHAAHLDRARVVPIGKSNA